MEYNNIKTNWKIWLNHENINVLLGYKNKRIYAEEQTNKCDF